MIILFCLFTFFLGVTVALCLAYVLLDQERSTLIQNAADLRHQKMLIERDNQTLKEWLALAETTAIQVIEQRSLELCAPSRKRMRA
jgi:hypothetical protein